MAKTLTSSQLIDCKILSSYNRDAQIVFLIKYIGLKFFGTANHAMSLIQNWFLLARLGPESLMLMRQIVLNLNWIPEPKYTARPEVERRKKFEDIATIV